MIVKPVGDWRSPYLRKPALVLLFLIVPIYAIVMFLVVSAISGIPTGYREFTMRKSYKQLWDTFAEAWEGNVYD